MAAPQGNQFWRLRSKHGRNKLFSTPELMWEAACEYFEWCEANPLMSVDFRGKDAEEVQIPKMRPFTIYGLCSYLGCNSVYFNDFSDGLKGKEDQESKDFSEVITRVRETIYNQKFTGAAAGFLNPTIIARDLGLKDSTDITTGGDKLESKETKIILSSGTEIQL